MPYQSDMDSMEEFSLHLAVVEGLIDSNQDSQVIFGGDFNVDRLFTGFIAYRFTE